MDITSNFVQDGQHWVANDIKVTGNFNLHLETDGMSSTTVYQKTVEDAKYSHLTTAVVREDESYECDICGEVFPKWIKLSCNKKPTLAVITY